MFTTYVDDSGHEDSIRSKVLVAAGFLAFVDQWLRFEDEWPKMLSRLGLPSCFHTADFIAGTGEFSDWKGKKRAQKHVLRSLAAAIKLRVRRTLNQSIVLDDYARVDKVYHLREAHGYPFTIAVRTCWKDINEWKLRYNPEASVKLVIEDGVK
ncbi:MAG: hypothetical protein ACRDF4_10970, partial [Rhabdochlamydiaceae bacterium]